MLLLGEGELALNKFTCQDATLEVVELEEVGGSVVKVEEVYNDSTTAAQVEQQVVLTNFKSIG